MHIHRSRFLRRGEVWFDAQPDGRPVDWIFYHQRPEPVPRANWKYFHTVVLDLSKSMEALLAGMSKSTAYKIRRARDRDGFTCQVLDPLDGRSLDEFEQVYDKFAALKHLPQLDRRLLDELARDRALEISVVRAPEGTPLAYHVYYRGPTRSFLLHAVSLYQLEADSGERNALGRANRFLFWSDILRHKELGLQTFDFGGWYPGDSQPELLEINRFKEGFGGRVIREYDCQQIVSIKGWIVLSAATILDWARQNMLGRRARPSSRGTPSPTATVADPVTISEAGSKVPPAAELEPAQ